MISYKDISFEEVSVIKDVWERNRVYHQNISKFFSDLYFDIVFEDRIKGFGDYEEGNIKITLAENEEDKNLLGYCISTMEGERGEPQTLHVIEEARGNGIGCELMKRHMKWLKENGCKSIKIEVSYENHNTIKFYEELGFRPNTIEMRLK